ncbi:hypothetical protein SSX86_011486 [Deinandra increscens subsp. villosa]|uniref:Uncharacterized protein n=1 Tax=Deinandra increscens subsp. villosa TaxID=3103831 RepID=A0AAP0H2R7_9ASTR
MRKSKSPYEDENEEDTTVSTKSCVDLERQRRWGCGLRMETIRKKALGRRKTVGLALSYAAPVVSLLGSFLPSFTEIEKELVSVERVLKVRTNIAAAAATAVSLVVVTEFEPLWFEFSAAMAAKAAATPTTEIAAWTSALCNDSNHSYAIALVKGLRFVLQQIEVLKQEISYYSLLNALVENTVAEFNLCDSWLNFSAAVRKYMRSIIKPGMPMVDLCETLENTVRNTPSSNDIWKGSGHNSSKCTPSTTRNYGSGYGSGAGSNSTVTFAPGQRSDCQWDDRKSQILRYLHVVSTSTLFSLFHL